MEDSAIIALYFDRNEDAIRETDKKYGAFCRKVAFNILSVNEDTEECVSDTYMKVWNLIPPERPIKFMAWLGKIVRNTALNLYTKLHSQKRFNGIEIMLDELSECIPSDVSLEKEIEDKEITVAINTWLKSISADERYLFIRRYWYGDAVNELAKQQKVSPHTMTQRLYRIREKLKNYFEKEGIAI